MEPRRLAAGPVRETSSAEEGASTPAHGTAELIYLVSFYGLVCLTLNGYDEPVPEETP